MKIAIILFETRISPRFDCAPAFMLICTDRGGREITEKSEISFQGSNYIERINQLKTAGADVVICGGISKDMLELLKANKIKVIPWVTGDAQKALQVFINRKLVPGAMLCSGRQIKQWGFVHSGRKSKKAKGEDL
jgi:predicted Fe-Mo cluster-binding NifX family protein